MEENLHSVESPPEDMHGGKAMGEMAERDADSPLNWSFGKKLHVCSAACGFTLALLFSATCFTTGVQEFGKEFEVSMQRAILPYSLFLFGVFFAPIIAPHLADKIGRTPLYFASSLSMAVFLAGAGASHSFTAFAVCRFFAGLCGGPAAVLIEGTFADVWPALYTGTYYAVLTLASYIGAALGAIIGNYAVVNQGWRWTQWIPMLFVFAACIFGIGMPESYPRQIQRSRARREGRPSGLPPSPSGDTISQMAKITVINPLIMFVSEPIAIMSELYLGVNFGVVFSWFIVVPAVLSMLFDYSPEQVSQAFTAAIAGVILGAISAISLDLLSVRLFTKKMPFDIEHRLIPAICGSCLQVAALFWIGWTSKPTFDPLVPIVGTAIDVMGSSMSLIGIISYLFDAYSPKGTLSALTVVACTRIFCAGIVPLFILTAITNLGGGWALSIFGFINAAFLIIPIVMFFMGKKLRAKSKHNDGEKSTLEEQLTGRNEQDRTV